MKTVTFLQSPAFKAEAEIYKVDMLKDSYSLSIFTQYGSNGEFLEKHRKLQLTLSKEQLMLLKGLFEGIDE